MKQVKSFLAALLAVVMALPPFRHRHERPIAQGTVAAANMQENQEPDHVEQENTQPVPTAQVEEQSLAPAAPAVLSDDSDWWITQQLNRLANNLRS